jgi:protein gp37
MSDQTKIEWTEATWNPVVGCSKVSEGCRNCYAEKLAYRWACKYIKNPEIYPYLKKYAMVIDFKTKRWNGEIYCDESELNKPLHWRKPRMIFVCSMSDLFHPKVPFEFIRKVFIVMYSTGKHTYQILTKRPNRTLEFYKWFLKNNRVDGKIYEWGLLKNLWLGVTIESPNHWKRAKILSQIPAAVRYTSCEPLLVYLGDLDFRGISWYIVGGESGPKARPMDIEWARSIVQQCQAAGVPVFVKQLGGYPNKRHKLEDFPEDLRIRQYPQNAKKM